MIERDELKALLSEKEEGVMVTFTKSDGTDRNMKCTLHKKNLPVPTEAVKEKKTRKKNEDPDLFVVFDMEKDAWRSFRFSAVTNVEVL